MQRSTAPDRDAGQLASSGGRANEAGSLHRSGVAAYLAAHGLAGRGVEAAWYPEMGPAPVSLAFETGDAVDDIRCGLADGTTLWLQAKRACGADAQLEATVAQWTGQVPSLRPGDRVGLVTAEPRGDVRHLGAALNRRRQPVQGISPAGEDRAIAAVRSMMPVGISELIADQVLDAAIVMAAGSSGPSDEGFRSVANLLDGTIVPAGCGSRAVRELQSAFKRQAAAGSGSGLDDWLAILAEAGLEVFADASGTAGQRRKAELDAIAAHRSRLASRDGVLEFSLLAEDLPPLVCEQLADSFKVSVPVPDPDDDGDGRPFLVTARRWPRMLLTGLPGMGKSKALEQAAARWATDSGAPVPVLVPLRVIALRNPRRSADVTLPVLLDAATAGTPEHERVPLRRALESAAHSGEIVLLLDGLDECGDRRGVVSDGLAEVVSSLPAGIGVLLATRHSGLAAARKLSLPVAELIGPYEWLNSALRRLLWHAAAAAQIPQSEQARWVRVRETQLDTIRRSHPELWRVPLLATLLTLLVIRRPDSLRRVSRAQLLLEAVNGTVDKWELTRLREARHREVMRAEQLTDGYGEIGRAVSLDASGCSTDLVLQRTAAMLRHRWGLAPAEATAVAREIMWFWDDHAGVFVASRAGDIIPRSRVFAEIGEAMWAVRQDSGTQQEWVRDAVRDHDHREPVVLAASLSPGIARELIDTAAHRADPDVGRRALTWAADAVAEGAKPPESSLPALLDALAQAAGAVPGAGTASNEPYGEPTRSWRPPHHAIRIARLPLPSAMRTKRDAALGELALDGRQRLLVCALAALADAHADSASALGRSAASSVRDFLAMPLPSLPEPPSVASKPTAISKFFHAQTRLFAGHQQVAELAATYARQLGPKAVKTIYQITRSGTSSDYSRVCERMTALGYPDPEPLMPAQFFAIMAKLTEQRHLEWKKFLTAAASIAEPRPLTLTERWRYPHLATLSDVLDACHTSSRGIGDALSADATMLPRWIEVAAKAASLDLPAISAEASAALESWQADNQDPIEVLHGPPPLPPPLFDATRISHDDLDVLIDALGATSEWLAHVARDILNTAGEQAIGKRALDRAQHLPPHRRGNAAIVAVANDPDPPACAARLLAGDDPPTRAGAAAAAMMLSGATSSRQWKAILGSAKADDDMTVRLAAGASQAAAEQAAHWSCKACGKINKARATNCAFCPDGARSGIRVVIGTAQ